MKTLPALLHLLALSLAPLHAAPAAPAQQSGPPSHTFVLGEKEFLLDGTPYLVRAGEIHYTRVPREYWRHRLRMCRAMGLNAVGVYLFWNYHEWEEGKFKWTGQADVAEFCRIAQEEGLWVILRPGPYVCAEWEMGGLPWWLLKNERIALRSADSEFIAPVRRYLAEVGRVLGPLQVTRGGPVLMVQVENEYGWFGKDPAYMGAIRGAIVDAGFEVPLYACNPPNVIQNGHREDLFQVVNFGANGARKAFETLARHQKTGPLMNGEYYPGWFDSWGHKHSVGALAPVLGDLEFMLKNRHSFSFYMAHGGSNFGLWAGACTDKPFMPISTSYDYDAPISEAGWATPKFRAVRDLFARNRNPGETIPDVPAAPAVVEIAPFTLGEISPLLEHLPAPRADETPRTMEAHDQSRGCILYRTTLPAGPAGSITADAVHDFAWVSINGKPAGVMDRRTKRFKVELPARTAPARLDILVEAMGRVNFGPNLGERKGLLAPVIFTAGGGASTAELKGWKVFPVQLDDEAPTGLGFRPAPDKGFAGPAYWRGEFTVARPGDTFLDTRGWGKGVVWINGRCLGRFWDIGPTQTLYLPGPWLRAGRNEVVVLDLTGPREPRLAGLAKPILDQLRPDLDFARRVRATGVFDTAGLAPAVEGKFTADVRMQEIRFTRPAQGRYLCFEARDAHDAQPFAAVADLDLLDAAGEVMNMPKPGWKVLWVDSEEVSRESGDAENALDSQADTHWHTEWSGKKPGFPHRLVIDLGESQVITGLCYLPRSGPPAAGGRVKGYRVYLSDRPFGLVAVE